QSFRFTNVDFYLICYAIIFFHIFEIKIYIMFSVYELMLRLESNEKKDLRKQLLLENRKLENAPYTILNNYYFFRERYKRRHHKIPTKQAIRWFNFKTYLAYEFLSHLLHFAILMALFSLYAVFILAMLALIYKT